MKKFLLLSALAAMAMTASAEDDYTNYFRVYVDGAEVENGATVFFTDPGDMPDFPMYDAHIQVINQTDHIISLFGSMSYGDQPTAEQARTDAAWGNYQLCYAYALSGGNCLAGNGTDTCIGTTDAAGLPLQPKDSKDVFEWQGHAMLKTNKETPSILPLIMIPKVDGEEMDCIFTMNVAYGDKPNGIEGVTDDSAAAAEYFDLAGRRVADPANGIFIERRGPKVVKRVIR